MFNNLGYHLVLFIDCKSKTLFEKMRILRHFSINAPINKINDESWLNSMRAFHAACVGLAQRRTKS